MKNTSSLIRRLLVCALALTVCLGSATAKSHTIYVSPKGNNKTNGALKTAPLRTLQAAVDMAESHSQLHPEDDVTIELLGGRYDISKTVEIGKNWRGASLEIIASGGEKVVISGGRSISPKSMRRVTDKKVIERIQPQYRDSIYEVDTKPLGLELADIRPSGFGRPSSQAWSELFVNGKPMRLSRWPNDSTALIGEVLVSGTGEYVKDSGLPVFKYKGDRPKEWSRAGTFWVAGYFAHGYADDMIRFDKIDTIAGTMHAAEHTVYGFMSGAAWRQWSAINLIEEIDRPGEWVLDASKGKIYFFPPERVGTIDVSVLEEPMIAIENCSNVLIKGLVIEFGRGMGVYMENTHNVLVDECSIRNMGSIGVSIGCGTITERKSEDKANIRAAESGGSAKSRIIGDLMGKIYEDVVFDRNAGTNNGIKNCYIYNVGAGGVSLGGGNRLTLTPSGNFIENCRIHDYNRVEKSYRPAVWIDGVGCRVSACDIYNAPSMAILFHGNDHIIEYCKITNVCSEVDDQGAIYYGRDAAERGNVIRYCYFKDLSPQHRVTATYHDDGACGGLVYGNIYFRAGSLPVLIGGGHDHKYINNIFIESPVAIHIDNRMQNWGQRMIAQDGIIRKRLEAVNYTKPPYSTAYPELPDYWNEDASFPRNNLIEGNLFYKVGNLMSGRTQWGEFINNWTTNKNPGFVDPNDPLKGFREDAAVFKHIRNFPKLPFEKIGCKLPEQDQR